MNLMGIQIDAIIDMVKKYNIALFISFPIYLASDHFNIKGLRTYQFTTIIMLLIKIVDTIHTNRKVYVSSLARKIHS